MLKGLRKVAREDPDTLKPYLGDEPQPVGGPLRNIDQPVSPFANTKVIFLLFDIPWIPFNDIAKFIDSSPSN